MLGRFDRAGRWLTMADGYPAPRRHAQRRRRAARSARSARNPHNADLWVGYGNALVVARRRHDEPGRPARLPARRRSSRPTIPAPRFFYGLALAQGGNYDEAERIWRAAARQPRRAERRLSAHAIEERLQRAPAGAGSGATPAARTQPRGLQIACTRLAVPPAIAGRN